MGHGRFKNLWPMRQPGLNGTREIFKCTECGAETDSPKGWNGEPDRHKCGPGCRCNSKLTIVSLADFGENFDQVHFGGIDVPTGPGANPVAEAMHNYADGWDRIFGSKSASGA